MFDTVFQLLLTTLALTGNQVYELDFRIGTLGEPAPAQLYSYRLAHPFESRVQMTNFAILCASLDWNAASLFQPALHRYFRVFSSMRNRTIIISREMRIMMRYNNTPIGPMMNIASAPNAPF